MIKIPTQYQICFFANLTDMRPSGKTIPTMLEALSQWGLLPSTFQEIKLQSPPEPRLLFKSPVSDEWNVQFESNRVNIIKNGIGSESDNMGDISSFLVEALEMLKRAVDTYPTKGSRLSLVQNYLSAELNLERLEMAYNKFVDPIDFFKENHPQNWNTRNSARITIQIGDHDEPTNVISSVNRIQGEFALTSERKEFDRIQTQIDINTNQRNMETRFSVADMEIFSQHAVSIGDQIYSEIEEKLSG